LAYLVPLLEHLSKYSLEVEKISRDKGTYAIIFSPTRELCTQIEVEMQKLLKLFNYVLCSTIMGGENPKKEKAKLRKGLTVVVCTPGRLLYHLQNTQSINFSRLHTIIIDEADRLLDMGFEKEMTQCMEQIKKRCPEKFTPEADLFHSESLRVNFVSATLTKKVELLGAKLMKSYKTVGFENDTKNDTQVSGEEMALAIPNQVQQFYMQVPIQYRLIYLLMFLYAHQSEKIIVFASNCEAVNLIHKILKDLDWNYCVNKRG
jgi:ATP-dependent RNA helicase DDX31/DBP7